MKLVIEQHITDLIDKPNGYRKIVQIIQASSAIVAGEYKKQMPVNKGAMRNWVYVSNNSDGYVVTTPMSYAKYVHEGTGRYKGQSDAGFHRGRVRESHFYGDGSLGKFNNNKLIFFKVLAKRGKIKGQKPNKFADRATRTTAPKVVQFIKNKIKPLLSP